MVGADEDAVLETPLKNEKSVVRIVRLQHIYEWLVRLVQGYRCRFGVTV